VAVRKPSDDPHGVDLDEVRALIEALERDLDRVKGDSADIQRLRYEIVTLKRVLHGPAHEHHRVRDALHGLRERIDRAMDAAVFEGLEASRYVTEIGRILGLG
jgi:hypothetical protein